MSPFALALIIFLAAFTLSLAGFGHALVAMPLLTPVLGISTAAPLVALVALTAEVLMLLRFRRDLNFGTVRRLVLASIIGIPLGVLAVNTINESIGLLLLGVIAVGYGLYALLNLRLPKIEHPNWGYGFGFLGGLLSGAYNTGGPPLVIYGNCRGWSPAEFKGNLQGLFLLQSVLVIAAHGLRGSLTPLVWSSYAIAVPAIVLGLLAGFSLEGRINPQTFRRIVLILLVILGVRLILASLLTFAAAG